MKKHLIFPKTKSLTSLLNEIFVDIQVCPTVSYLIKKKVYPTVFIWTTTSFLLALVFILFTYSLLMLDMNFLFHEDSRCKLVASVFLEMFLVIFYQSLSPMHQKQFHCFYCAWCLGSNSLACTFSKFHIFILVIFLVEVIQIASRLGCSHFLVIIEENLLTKTKKLLDCSYICIESLQMIADELTSSI